MKSYTGKGVMMGNCFD